MHGHATPSEPFETPEFVDILSRGQDIDQSLDVLAECLARLEGCLATLDALGLSPASIYLRQTVELVRAEHCSRTLARYGRGVATLPETSQSRTGQGER